MAHNENTLHFSEYLRIVRNRLWVIFTIFALTLLTGIFVTVQVLPKSYSSTAQIRIQSANNAEVNSLGGNAFVGDHPIDSYEFQTEYERIHSPTVLEPVITDLGLDKSWAKKYYHSTFDKLPMQDALSFLDRIVSINFKHGSNLVEITARSEDPKEATAIANAVVDSYKKIRDNEQGLKSSNGAETLQEQITDQEKLVADRKAYREQLRQRLLDKHIVLDPGNGDMSSTINSVSKELEARQRDLLEAQQDADKRRVLYDSTKSLSDAEFVSTLEGMQRAPANLTGLENDILTAEGNIQNLLKEGFDSQHPRVLAAQAQLDQERMQFKTLIEGARNALKIDAEMADSGVALLQKTVNELQAQVASSQSKDIVPFIDADHDYQKQQTLLDTLNIRLREAQSTANLLESPVKIIAPAEVPDVPSSPNVNLNIAISAFAGLFCGIVVAFLIEYLDTSVKTMADAEQLLGLPVLTVIPNKGGPMPLTQQTARLPHAEGYRILRAKLNLKVQNGLGPSVTMLSGGPGEGKSTTIYNLAIVCAQAGQSVILVDCDLRRPTLHDLLDVSNDRGVSNFLRNEGDPLDFIQQTQLPKLHVLTAGETPMSDIGNLSGDKIRAMLDELKQRYDLVLIDAPPVLGISDGSIIAREADYVILVIQHRRYPGEISLRAKRAIEEVHGNCVGMVLNAVSVQSDDSYYYYSSYGNYYQKDGKKRRKKKSGGVAVNGTSGADVKTVRVGHTDHEDFDRVKALPLLGFVLSCLFLSGCAGAGGGSSAPTMAQGGASTSDSIRVGDKITVRLIGVPQGEEYVNEIQVPESGDITVPDLTQTFHVAGMRPGDLANRIASAYREAKIYTNPNVTVNPEERYVNITGDVKQPLRVVYTPDLTVLGAISAAGGFDEYADKRHVRILRGSQLMILDAQKATNTPGADMIVYPGDQITVPRTIF